MTPFYSKGNLFSKRTLELYLVEREHKPEIFWFQTWCSSNYSVLILIPLSSVFFMTPLQISVNPTLEHEAKWEIATLTTCPDSPSDKQDKFSLPYEKYGYCPWSYHWSLLQEINSNNQSYLQLVIIFSRNNLLKILWLKVYMVNVY